MSLGPTSPLFDQNRAELAAWLNPRIYGDHVTSPTKTLRSYLTGDAVEDAKAAYQFLLLHKWAFSNGVNALLQGNAEGSAILAHAHHYGFWWFRCQLAAVTRLMDGKKDLNAVFGLRELGLLSAHAMALGQFANADIFADKTEAALARGLVHGQSVSPVGSFMLHLQSRRRGRPVPPSQRPLRDPGGYQLLLDQYDSPNLDSVTGAFRIACDFHVEQSRELDEESTPDFFQVVYRLYPVELLGALRLRASLGLEMPVIPHLLMTGPTGTLQPMTATDPDPLLLAVVERFRAKYPEL